MQEILSSLCALFAFAPPTNIMLGQTDIKHPSAFGHGKAPTSSPIGQNKPMASSGSVTGIAKDICIHSHSKPSAPQTNHPFADPPLNGLQDLPTSEHKECLPLESFLHDYIKNELSADENGKWDIQAAHYWLNLNCVSSVIDLHTWFIIPKCLILQGPTLRKLNVADPALH
jgi:hypothetical protein